MIYISIKSSPALTKILSLVEVGLSGGLDLTNVSLAYQPVIIFTTGCRVNDCFCHAFHVPIHDAALTDVTDVFHSQHIQLTISTWTMEGTGGRL